ncbi:MAG: UDP-glucose 4-epimerase GalE [Alphaproteobacteria bacterium]|nr:UDP-glucose 4-epimerase GalE [Alphaproteobacteria bacterium]
MKPIFVTGGAGYIGSHMVLALREEGRPVVVFDDLSTGRRELVPDDVPLIVGDIRDTGALCKAIKQHGCDSVMHFAAKIAVEESVREPELYRSVNVDGTQSLLEAMRLTGVTSMVFSSTAAVYGEGKDQPCAEDDSPSPTNPYGATKLACEGLIRQAAQDFGLRHVILRYFNVAGADPLGRSGQCGPESSHLIRAACEAACGIRDKITIFGTDYTTPDGTCLRDYIHVSDLVGAHVAALGYLAEPGKENLILNVGYGQGTSVREVLKAVERASGKPLPVVEGPRRPGDSAVVIAEARRIREILGWVPRHDSLDEIVISALAWEAKKSN